MSGAARKLSDARSAAAKLPPGPAREKALNVAARKIAAILEKHNEGVSAAERMRRFEALKRIANATPAKYRESHPTAANPARSRIHA